ncbi:hypothetical protein ACOSQ2_007705 [Xanthoceras sorbifolium]
MFRFCRRQNHIGGFFYCSSTPEKPFYDAITTVLRFALQRFVICSTLDLKFDRSLFIFCSSVQDCEEAPASGFLLGIRKQEVFLNSLRVPN